MLQSELLFLLQPGNEEEDKQEKKEKEKFFIFFIQTEQNTRERKTLVILTRKTNFLLSYNMEFNTTPYWEKYIWMLSSYLLKQRNLP